MPIRRLRDYLDNHQVRYSVISHSPAYTAQEIAASAHISGKTFAKTVMVSVDGNMAMVVLPGSRQLDFELLQALCGTHNVLLASEKEFSTLFPECEIGAMPPFGNLYGMEVYADDDLDESEEICFNAGAHTEVLRMLWSDYRRLVNPLLARLSLKT